MNKIREINWSWIKEQNSPGHYTSNVLTSNHFNKLVTLVHEPRVKTGGGPFQLEFQFSRDKSIKHPKKKERRDRVRNRWERSHGTKNAFAVEFQRSKRRKKGSWMIYRWIHVPRRIFTCSPMAELLSNIGFYSVEQRRIVDIIESQGSGDWLHASRWMKVAGTRWRLMGVNSRYDLLSSVSLSKRIYRLLRILPAWFYLVFNYPQGLRDKGVAAVVSQVNVASFYLHQENEENQKSLTNLFEHGYDVLRSWRIFGMNRFNM